MVDFKRLAKTNYTNNWQTKIAKMRTKDRKITPRKIVHILKLPRNKQRKRKKKFFGWVSILQAWKNVE